jgi:prepilin-type N-terminal cleavage/methylation domain-containing protein
MTMTHTQPIRRLRPTRASSGFTLVEILIVVSIAAVVMTVIAGGAFAGIRFMKINQTKATLTTLQAVMDDYKKEKESYPVFNISTLSATSPYAPTSQANDGTRVFLGLVYYGDSVHATMTNSDDKIAGNNAVGAARDHLQSLGTTVFDRKNAVIYDAWGHAIFVTTAGTATTHGKFRSAGPDGKPNTSDDITSLGGSS